MNELSGIEFFQLKKPRTKNLAKALIKRFNKQQASSEVFEQKVSRIKRNAEIINKKLNKC